MRGLNVLSKFMILYLLVTFTAVLGSMWPTGCGLGMTDLYLKIEYLKITSIPRIQLVGQLSKYVL